MFAFDYWADWLKAKVSDLNIEAYELVRFHDSRPLPETALNPSFGLSLDSENRIGFIGFWKVGLCDYQVFDVHRDKEVANEAGLEASDETISILFDRFMSFYSEGDS